MSGATTREPRAAGVVLEVRDLVVHFAGRGTWRRRGAVKAVDGVSFDITQGEILALVGESGCGKSTIALAVMRLLAPTSGQIMSGGEDLATLKGRALRRARQRIQMIFQDPFGSLNPRRTVYDTVSEPLAIHKIGATAEERRAMVMDALSLAHLRPPERLAEGYPHELSGGQRQRVAIASAMVMRPELVIADEPVSMLDVSIRAGILNLMVELREREDVSLLYITHDLASARYVADRIVVMYAGQIAEEGPAEAVLSQPRHPYTRLLLSAVAETAEADAEFSADTGEPPRVINPGEGCRFRWRCPFAVEICHTVTPRPRPIGAAQVACHRAEELPAPATSGYSSVLEENAGVRPRLPRSS